MTGKYHREGPIPESDRAQEIVKRYFNDKNFALLERLETVGKKRGKTTLQMALGWLLTDPVVTSPIIGANTVEQLKESLGAVGLRLSQEEMATLDQLSAWEEEK